MSTEIVVILISAIILVVLLRRGIKRFSNKMEVIADKKKSQILNHNIGWLREKWEIADKEQDSGKFEIVPKWFFDKITDSQLRRLKEDGITIRGKRPTKGQASDIIGLFEPIQDKSKEILQFFKIPLKGMNQSRAMYEIARIFANPEKRKIWQERPITSKEKEFYRFFNIREPAGTTHAEASCFIDDYQDKLADDNEERLNEWDTYENIYEEINDPDIRKDYKIRKISFSAYRDAIERLKKEGKKISDLEYDIDIVIDKIIEMNPQLKKE
jgi:hypothetical protein